MTAQDCTAYEASLASLSMSDLVIEYETKMEKYALSVSKGEGYEYVRLARREVVRRLNARRSLS